LKLKSIGLYGNSYLFNRVPTTHNLLCEGEN